MPLNVKKQELKELLYLKLIERGDFGEPAPAEGVQLGEHSGNPAPLSPKDLPVQAKPDMTAEELRLTLHIKEVEVKHRELEVEAMHLRVRALELERGATVAASPSTPVSPSSGPQDSFDVGRHIALVPPFRESEVDSYFCIHAFERIAATLHWPKSVWPLLLQCKLVGKAQEVSTSLTIEDGLDYDVVKATVLRAYELVPEAYRQKFRNCERTATQTYVEFAKGRNACFLTNGARPVKLTL